LAALGLSLAFGVTKFLNVSHGELMMLGGYASFVVFTRFGVDPFLTLPSTMIILGVVGVILYKLVFSRMVKLPEEARIKNTLLVGFGLSLILQNIALRLWTADDRGITTFYSGWGFTILDVRLPFVRLAILALAIVVFLSMHLFLKKTYTGKAIRATVEDWEAAALMGIDIHKVYLLSFALGAALAGLAGALVSVGYSINPSMGLTWTLIALIVMVLGGLGSIMGTLAGGLLLGVTQSSTAFFLGGTYREVVGLLIFLIILVFRPQGLFGKKGD
jgi:branched-chain amino acid transport system permease protein